MQTSGSAAGAEELARERATGLFRFLRGVCELRSSVVRDVDRYESVLWLADVPRHANCSCVLWDGAAVGEPEVWLEVRRPRLTEPPAPPAAIEALLDDDEVRNCDADLPPLHEERLPQGDAEALREARAAWEGYVEGQWWAWAESERPVRRVNDIYQRLFTMHQRQESLGEDFEVVAGLGLLTWKTPSGHDVRRHLITARVSIVLLARGAVLRVGAGGEGARPRLEQDMLEVDERPGPQVLTGIEEALGSMGDEVLQPGFLDDALTGWVHAVRSSGRFEHALAPLGEPGPDPVVSLAPALILRKRTASSLIRMLNAILDQLDGGGPVPPGVERLVVVPEGHFDRAGPTQMGAGDDPQDGELYFPLPANPEQLQILERLAHATGVVVEGPPGTGKSHTIANLICHLLACGKRVLVTSHAPRALRVLRNKIPDDVAALCVSVLGDDRAALKGLEDSVETISQRYQAWDQRANAAEVGGLQAQLDKLRRRQGDLQATLRGARQAETVSYTSLFGAYAGTPQAIGAAVRADESRFSWFPGHPPTSAEPPLSDEEACELLWLLRDTAGQAGGDPLAGVSEDDRPVVVCLLQTDEGCLRKLRGVISDLLEKREALASHSEPWVQRACTECLSGVPGQWRALLRLTAEELRGVEGSVREVGKRTVARPDHVELDQLGADATELLGYLEAGGRLRPRWWVMWRAPLRRTAYLLADVRVDGATCDRPEVLRALLQLIHVEEGLARLRTAWTPHAAPAESTPAVQSGWFRDRQALLEECLQLPALREAARAAAAAIPDCPQPPWGSSEGLTAMARQAGVAAGILRRSQQLEANQRRCGELLERARSHAPELAAALEAGFAGAQWDGRMASFVAAWNWARADAWLRKVGDPRAVERAAGELEACREQILGTMGRLAAAKAWGHCFGRMTEHHRQSLHAWQLAVRRVGKGTGKHASRHRREAREHMQACRSAIPAWIMPVYRAAETLRPGADPFDVAIVDEASQSGPEALFLQYLAPTVVVVGDDNQIAPEFVGTDPLPVEGLRRQHLRGIPHADVIGTDHSFFDVAALRYGARVQLREHFRCMPEIIQFSNELCYQSHPLVPLRQYGSERLEPVVVRPVPDGYRKRQGTNWVNPPEAEAVVEQIVRCCRDPRYVGKSIGVISLQGSAQAALVEKLLLERLGTEEIADRRAVCGDAYAFQGDERDVVFLSLVAASGGDEGSRIGPLTKRTDMRRFNVAASRAKDQMWLFHTATLADLNPECMRYRLLDYCLNPRVQARPPELGQDAFDSQFERAVFQRIAERGYRVLPQFPVAGYRIDLVVEGLRGRLAVECDGDRWHGPERYEEDMRRERDLGRCGWTFFRVPGSSFYRDPDGALAGLWELLEKHGIFPSASRPAANAGPGPSVPVEVPRRARGVPDARRRDGAGSASGREEEAEAQDAPHGAPTVPDPRTAPTAEVGKGLLQIVAAHGPLVQRHLYRLYAQGAGCSLARHAKAGLNRAMHGQLTARRLEQHDELGTHDSMDRVVRVPGTAPVVVRPRGDRELDEIPPSEIAEVMRQVLTASPALRGDQLFRAILRSYDVQRMSAKHFELLDRVWTRYRADIAPHQPEG